VSTSDVQRPLLCVRGIDSEDQGSVSILSTDLGEFLTVKQRRVVGPLTWTEPLLDGATRFLAGQTTASTKVTMIGPASLAPRLIDEFSSDQAALADVPNAGCFQHPQRDSNPCRHLEKSTEVVRPVPRERSRPSGQG